MVMTGLSRSMLGQSGAQHGQGRRGPGLQVGFTTTPTFHFMAVSLI
jgi:hypothetical protein